MLKPSVVGTMLYIFYGRTLGRYIPHILYIPNPKFPISLLIWPGVQVASCTLQALGLAMTPAAHMLPLLGRGSGVEHFFPAPSVQDHFPSFKGGYYCIASRKGQREERGLLWLLSKYNQVLHSEL